MLLPSLSPSKLLFSVTLVVISPLAVSETSLNSQDSIQSALSNQTSSKLDLSVGNLSAESGDSLKQEQTEMLSSNQRQALENLKIAPKQNPVESQVKKQNGSEPVIGGSVMTEANQNDSLDPIETGKNYLDSVDGAKVDVDLKF